MLRHPSQLSQLCLCCFTVSRLHESVDSLELVSHVMPDMRGLFLIGQNIRIVGLLLIQKLLIPECPFVGDRFLGDDVYGSEQDNVCQYTECGDRNQIQIPFQGHVVGIGIDSKHGEHDHL